MQNGICATYSSQRLLRFNAELTFRLQSLLYAISIHESNRHFIVLGKACKIVQQP